MPIPGLYKIFDHWHQEGTAWVISDTHFGDKELAAGTPNRPDDETLLRLINAKCGKNDCLIHLGDVGDISYVARMRARHKVLICGNHDRGITNYMRDTGHFCLDKTDCADAKTAVTIAKERYPGYEIGLSDVGTSWVLWYDNHLFDEVYSGVLSIGEKLILSHEPIDVPWAFNIHGHRHTKQPNDDHHLNACLDATGYQILNLNQLMKDGLTSKVETIHRDTIDRATERKRRRGGKKCGTK